jgi:uncharacterized membrane protein YfcA
VHIDLYLALAGLVVGFTAGLTGMGGGALMTPILVIFFRNRAALPGTAPSGPNRRRDSLMAAGISR